MSEGYILIKPEPDLTPFQIVKGTVVDTDLTPFQIVKEEVVDTDNGKKKGLLLALSWLSRVITSVGNFSIQYNFQAIAIALIVMSVEECTLDKEKCQDGKQSSWVTGTASATVFAGAMLGQLIMGYTGDILGRDKAMTLTLTLASSAGMFI
jgi:MFS family permease